MSKAYLTKADLLAGITLKPQDLEIEGLGLVQVRGLGLAELDEIQVQANGRDLLLALYGAQRGLINPQLSTEELNQLAYGDAQIVSNIAERVFSLSARGDRKEIDPLVGNGS